MQVEFDHTIDCKDFCGDRVNLVRKWGESFEKAPANLKKYSGARIPNAPKNLDGSNFGLKFQFKILRMW